MVPQPVSTTARLHSTLSFCPLFRKPLYTNKHSVHSYISTAAQLPFSSSLNTAIMDSQNHTQASTNYKEAFSLFDKRGTGRVSLDSLGDLLRACGQNPTLAEIADLEKTAGGDCMYNFSFPSQQTTYLHRNKHPHPLAQTITHKL
jgi:hypothetical protein